VVPPRQELFGAVQMLPAQHGPDSAPHAPQALFMQVPAIAPPQAAPEAAQVPPTQQPPGVQTLLSQQT
jgi:hypothetical protein